jgi:hypothetical protein
VMPVRAVSTRLYSASAPKGPLGYTRPMIIWAGIITLILLGFAACMWIIYEEYHP